MKKPFKLAQLYDAGGKTDKDWYVYYFVLNPENKYSRFKKRGNINSYSHPDHRRKYAQTIINEINKLLMSGWIPDPIKNWKKLKRENNRWKDYTVAEALEIAKKAITAGRRHRTIGAYESIIKRFSKFCLKEDLHKMKIMELSKKYKELYIDYLASYNLSGRTINTHLSYLRIAFNSLIDREVINHNIFANFKKIPFETNAHEIYTEAEIIRIRKHVKNNNPGLWILIQLIYYCFIRPQEITQLKIKHIDINKQTIIIPGNISKNRKTELVAIPDSFVHELNSYISNADLEDHVIGKSFRLGEKLHRNRLTVCHKKTINEIGIYKTLYAWKHTGVSRAVQSGINLRQLQLQLRHKSLDQMMTYLRSIGVDSMDEIKNKMPQL